MPTIKRSIIVDASIDITFDLSNRIDLWPEMMAEYAEAEIIKREGRMLWFRLRHQTGNSWTSWRMLSPPNFACAERYEPKAPFKYMHLVWTYGAVDTRQTEMTWDMCFELPDDQKDQEEVWSRNMLDHTEANQKRMKAYIEQYVKERS